LAPGSQFCAKCGASIPASSAGQTLPPPQMQQAPVYAAPPPTPKKSRKLLWIGIIVVVVIIIVVIAVLAGSQASAVKVTAINITSSDDACHSNGNSLGGYTTNAGGSVSETIAITNTNIILSCTINSVSATTSGFSISGTNTPLTIPAGGTESLSFT